MNKILIVRAIFCPDYEQFKITFENLYNLLNYISSIKSNIFSLDLLVIGWSKSNYSNYFNILNKLYRDSKLFNNIFEEIFKINYGKYKILNHVKSIANNYDGIFYSDHDISIDLDHYGLNIFRLFYDATTTMINDKKISFIALNQKYDVRHQFNIYQNKITINKTEFVYPNLGSFGAIADGCFYIDGMEFSKMQDLELNTVYGLDDYYLLKGLYELGSIGVVAKDIFVKHPISNNFEYIEWKKNKVLNLVKNLKNNKKFDYQIEIQQSNNFWS